MLQVLDEGLGNQSYVVSLPDRAALVIDPSRDPRPYVDVAERENLKIAFAAETHLHADFISGTRELAAKGAVVVAPAAAELQGIGYRGLADGDEVDLNGLTLRALATPGHTPEHLAYLLLEESTPRALFSGGALIPGGAARTDLIEPDQTEPLAHALYRLVRQHLAGLPDDLVVYPTHGAGSFCSTGAGGQRTTTLGWERDTNPLLTLTDEDTFVRTFIAGFGTYPSYFRALRAVNRRGAPVYGVNPPQLRPLTVDEMRREMAAGAALIDARSLEDFANGHIAGALSISLRPAFASWLGWLLPADRPLLFVMSPEQDRTDLVAQALKIGYDRIIGELEGGMASWRAQSLPESTIALLHAGDDLGIAPLDVRQENEWEAGHIPGAVHVELGGLPQSARTVPAGPLTIYCGHGERAMTAASLLEPLGRGPLAVLEGGFAGWEHGGGVGVSG